MLTLVSISEIPRSQTPPRAASRPLCSIYTRWSTIRKGNYQGFALPDGRITSLKFWPQGWSAFPWVIQTTKRRTKGKGCQLGWGLPSLLKAEGWERSEVEMNRRHWRGGLQRWLHQGIIQKWWGHRHQTHWSKVDHDHFDSSAAQKGLGWDRIQVC